MYFGAFFCTEESPFRSRFETANNDPTLNTVIASIRMNYWPFSYIRWFFVIGVYMLGVHFDHPLMVVRYHVLRWLYGNVRFSVGDSHSLFSFAWIRNVARLPQGPLTMHRIGRDGFETLSLFGQTSFFWPKTILRKGDTIFLSFGEIDCRCHIANQVAAGRTEEEVIRTLATRYIEALLRAREEGVTLCVVSVTPPAYSQYIDHFRTYQSVGSDADRARYTLLLNTTLMELCRAHAIPYLDTYRRYADMQGMLIYALSDGQTHIGKTQQVQKALDQLAAAAR